MGFIIPRCHAQDKPRAALQRATVLKHRRRGWDQPAMQTTTRNDNNGTDLATDSVHEILSNERRRLVLCLVRKKGTTTKGELAEAIAAYENDKEIREITSQERKRVLISLHQCHLEKLSDHGVVQYERDAGIVDPGRHFEQCAWYLDNGPSEKRGLSDVVRILWR